MYDASTNAHACAQENDMLALASQLTDRSRLHIDNDIDDLGHDQRALMVQVHELTVAIKRERESEVCVCCIPVIQHRKVEHGRRPVDPIPTWLAMRAMSTPSRAC
jgi:hypothetical protein